MNRQSAERAVVISALSVFAIYFYRLATEGSGKTKTGSNGLGQLLGVGTPANIGRFITGWGFAYLTMAVMTEASPPLGGSFAILVGISDFLANVGQVAKDMQTSTTKKPAVPSTPPAVPSTPPTHVTPVNASGTPAHGGMFN